mmetsp:Transcript_54824/g.177383  ORF Transcript_54824/g.177383 Transcript_54824/m.177383 type:complete len:216 (+) Transcript_54824:754-1401(+)
MVRAASECSAAERGPMPCHLLQLQRMPCHLQLEHPKHEPGLLHRHPACQDLWKPKLRVAKNSWDHPCLHRALGQTIAPPTWPALCCRLRGWASQTAGGRRPTTAAACHAAELPAAAAARRVVLSPPSPRTPPRPSAAEAHHEAPLPPRRPGTGLAQVAVRVPCCPMPAAGQLAVRCVEKGEPNWEQVVKMDVPSLEPEVPMGQPWMSWLSRVSRP